LLVFGCSGWESKFKGFEKTKIMKRKPLLVTFFAGLALCLPCAAANAAPQGKTSTQNQAVSVAPESRPVVPRAHLAGLTGAPDEGRLPADGNLPESASALPLLSAIGAGALLGGLLSARRTRSGK
jgi:hypothetical protein